MKRIKKDIYLPNDVVNEILLRLPAKSLGRCKCVCKTWYNLIQTPIFVKIHFHHPQNPIRLFAFTSAYAYSSNDYELALFSDESFSIRKDIRNPVCGCYIKHILGPVQGLYFMSYFTIKDDFQREFHYGLWNPTTSEFRELPSPSCQQTEGYRLTEVHLEFGCTNEDVKVILFHNNGLRKVVYLYSLAQDSWKGIYNYPCKLIDPDNLEEVTATHLNGACYWIGVNFLLVFDMTNEVFREVNLPAEHDYTDVGKDIWVRDNSSLVFFANHYSHDYSSDDSSEFTCDLVKIDLWEMKGEGDWFNFFPIDPSSTYVSSPYFNSYGFWKKDVIFIDGCSNAVCLYNLYSHENRAVNTLGLGKGGKNGKMFFYNYKQSLTSVRGGSLL